MNLKLLGDEIRSISESKGWSTPTSFEEVTEISAKLCLIHSEVTEALEAVRHDNLENFEEELADTIIRILHLASGLGLNLDVAIRAKVEINKTRDYMHGDKRL